MQFLAAFDFKPTDHKDAQELEDTYFKDARGKIIGRVNDTHCLVTAKML